MFFCFSSVLCLFLTDQLNDQFVPHLISWLLQQAAGILESSFVVFSSYEESWLHSRPVICILLLHCVVCVYMLCGLVDCHTDRLSAACAGVFHTFVLVPSFSGPIINDGRPVFRVHTWHHSHHARCPHKQLWDHQLLVQRKVTIPRPHQIRCDCVECVSSSEVDSLRHSRSRLNIYKALASPSLIALSSEDPILTAFRLGWELKELSKVENEFRQEYEELSQQCKLFAKDLLDQARSSRELETILNHRDDQSEELDPRECRDLAKLKLAIKYHQKEVRRTSCSFLKN